MLIPFNDRDWYQKSISKLQKLENISGIRDTNGEWLQNVPNISNLKYLKFENSNVKLNIFEKFTNLDTLIIDCENFEKEKNILLPNSLKHFTCMRKLDYESIENLINKCHNLQELKINSNELNDELFEKMLINLHHLLCLKIFNIENSLTPQMYNIFKSNDIQFKLTKLRIPWYLSKENNECQKSLKHMSNTLQSISIDFIGDASVLDCKLFLKTIDNLKNLKKISLFMEHIAELLESSENDFPTILLPNLLKFKCICLDDDWSTFIECFLQPSLKTLIIHNRESFTDPYKINMEKYSFNLENLKLIGTFKFITDFIIDRTDFPTQFSNLVSLEGNEITDEFLPYLNGQLLQKLEISKVVRLNYFEKFKKLKKLNIQFSTNDFKDLIFTSPYLKELVIQGSNFNGLEEGLLSALFTLDSLKTLRFIDCPNLCNDFVKSITRLKEKALLSVLIFLRCHSLTREGVFYLKEFKDANVSCSIYN
ncbi:hypothetical protein ABK040_013110 [Willaertia magna]